MADDVESGSANLEAMDAARSYQAAMTQLLIAQMRLESGVVVDFGAGTGAYTRQVARAMPQWSVRALEPNRSLHRHYEPGTIAYADLAEVAPRSLDGAFSLNVFEHIPEHEEILAQLASKCRVGAPIFILVPAHRALWSPMDDLVGHVRRYSLLELESLGRSAGMTISASGWFDGTGYLASKVYQFAVRAGLLTKVDGTISTQQVAAFDKVFAVLEPILRQLRVPLGKNCWVRLQA